MKHPLLPEMSEVEDIESRMLKSDVCYGIVEEKELLKQLKEEEMMMHSSDQAEASLQAQGTESAQIENPEVIEEDDPNIWRPRFTSNRTIKYICDFVEYCKSYIM